MANIITNNHFTAIGQQCNPMCFLWGFERTSRASSPRMLGKACTSDTSALFLPVTLCAFVRPLARPFAGGGVGVRLSKAKPRRPSHVRQTP